jgi:hypothetical protein
MNAITPLVGVGLAICAAMASVAVARFHRGLLPKIQVAAFVFAGLVLIGAAAIDLILVNQADGGAEVQAHLDATTAHSADLRRRIDANVAAMTAALAEPLTSHEPPSVERDQAWQKKIGSLANETAALLKERDALVAEIYSIQPSVGAANNRDSQQRFSIILTLAMIGYAASIWLATFAAGRKERAEARAAAMRQFGLDTTPASDEVKHLAASGDKIRAIKAYRDATGASLVEAKNAVESLFGR